MEGFFNSKTTRVLASAVLGMLILALASYSILNFKNAKTAGEYPANISVEGKGEIQAVPDVGQFSFSVMATGATASEVQEASATKINDIMAYLKEQGVEEKDIKTQDYNLYPKYRWEERPCAFGMVCPPGEQVQDGFEVSQTVSVKVRDTAKAGALVAGVGEKGATNISGISFVVDDEEKLKAQARDAAIADAKAKAAKLADQLGVDLVRIVSFYENPGYYPSPMYEAKAYDMAEGMGGATVAPSMPTGEQTTAVTVNITYEIR